MFRIVWESHNASAYDGARLAARVAYAIRPTAQPDRERVLGELRRAAASR